MQFAASASGIMVSTIEKFEQDAHQSQDFYLLTLSTSQDQASQLEEVKEASPSKDDSELLDKIPVELSIKNKALVADFVRNSVQLGSSRQRNSANQTLQSIQTIQS